MIDLEDSATALKDTLSVTREPIAVKFFEDMVSLDGFELLSGSQGKGEGGIQGTTEQGVRTSC